MPEAALLIKRVIDARMGAEIYKETVLKGYDPRDFVIFAAGGAGPVHCCGYAEAAGHEQGRGVPVLLGLLRVRVLDHGRRARVRALAALLAAHRGGRTVGWRTTTASTRWSRRSRELARRDFAGEGFDPDQVRYTLELDMKFGGQLNVKRVASPLLQRRLPRRTCARCTPRSSGSSARPTARSG